ncbi:hypothetical protein R6Q57_029688 [Mikania cordata]
MNPFNTPGYRPQMSSPNQPNFYYNLIDYRDHTQDDLDSIDHNKSVKVESEEEEEPVRPTGKKAIGKKAPAKRWTDEE